MSKSYKFNLDGKFYTLDESDYYELKRGLSILKSIAFFDHHFETIVPGLFTIGHNEWEFKNFEYDYLGIEEEDDMFEISFSYRISLENLYKKIGSSLSDDLKPLFCKEGVPYLLFYDSQMNLAHDSICTAVVNREEDDDTELVKRLFLYGNKDGKKEFYSKYYEPLEKLVDLIESIDPFNLFF